MKTGIFDLNRPWTAMARIGGAMALTVALLLGVAAPTGSAAAQNICVKRSEVLKQLDRRFGEAPTALGLSNNGTIIEVFSRPDGGSWTMVMTRPDGLSCVIAAGEAWHPVERVAGGPGV